MKIIKCKKCKKNFTYKLVGIVYPGCKDQEDIICPYCNEVNGYEMTSQFVHVNKIKEKKKEKQNG